MHTQELPWGQEPQVTLVLAVALASSSTWGRQEQGLGTEACRAPPPALS